MVMLKDKVPFTHRNLFIVTVLLLTVSGMIFVLEITGTINLYTKDGQTSTDTETTSTEPSAQADFTKGDDRQAGNTIREDEGSASVADNNGEIDSSLDKSQPTTSSTGEITLFTPTKNLLAKNQVHITGTSTLDAISYRLVDSVSGVLARGELSVINGQFSGTLNIETNASEGRLDIFGHEADGNEFSNIAIPLRFR